MHGAHSQSASRNGTGPVITQGGENANGAGEVLEDADGARPGRVAAAAAAAAAAAGNSSGSPEAGAKGDGRRSHRRRTRSDFDQLWAERYRLVGEGYYSDRTARILGDGISEEGLRLLAKTELFDSEYWGVKELPNCFLMGPLHALWDTYHAFILAPARSTLEKLLTAINGTDVSRVQEQLAGVPPGKRDIRPLFNTLLSMSALDDEPMFDLVVFRPEYLGTGERGLPGRPVTLFSLPTPPSVSDTAAPFPLLSQLSLSDTASNEREKKSFFAKPNGDFVDAAGSSLPPFPHDTQRDATKGIWLPALVLNAVHKCIELERSEGPDVWRRFSLRAQQIIPYLFIVTYAMFDNHALASSPVPGQPFDPYASRSLVAILQAIGRPVLTAALTSPQPAPFSSPMQNFTGHLFEERGIGGQATSADEEDVRIRLMFDRRVEWKYKEIILTSVLFPASRRRNLRIMAYLRSKAPTAAAPSSPPAPPHPSSASLHSPDTVLTTKSSCTSSIDCHINPPEAEETSLSSFSPLGDDPVDERSFLEGRVSRWLD
ncbi:hypothetical protein JCM10213v2_007731 [Rhodosporidiobolus nylandii]